MIIIKNKAVINELRRMGFLNALQEENAPVDASKAAPMVVQVTRDVKSKSEYEAKQLMDDAKSMLAELEADYKAVIDSRDFRKALFATSKDQFDAIRLVKLFNDIRDIETKADKLASQIDVIFPLVSDDDVPVELFMLVERVADLQFCIAPLVAWMECKSDFLDMLFDEDGDGDDEDDWE